MPRVWFSRENGNLKSDNEGGIMEFDVQNNLPENPYLLLTPGPLSTSKTVKQVMLRDWCTWDNDYNKIVQGIRTQLIKLAGENTDENYSSVLMQGSGTFCVESVIVTAIPDDGKLLVPVNGAYGKRIVSIAEKAGIPVKAIDFGELSPPNLETLENELKNDPYITHVGVVHCETTTGMLNPVEKIGVLIKKYNKVYIVDAMSSFGGIPLEIKSLGADFIISSANKCIQGVPGFGFIIVKRSELEKLSGRSRSLSLDLYDQWRVMEEHQGKWRFTSPTHVVRAFSRALKELWEEGGVTKRYARYLENHRILMEGMSGLGFRALLDAEFRSPIITAFFNPSHAEYRFDEFYKCLKEKGFVIYPGKVTAMDTFRIGNIGDVWPEDMRQLIRAVKESMYWQ